MRSRRSTPLYLAPLFTLFILSTLTAQIDPVHLSGIRARSIGPAGMSGRVASIDAVVSDPDTIYVGAATGGVWKSRDGGITWKPIFDKQPVAAVGAVAVFQPEPDLVWVGTGEGNPRNSASVGNGIYKSLDAGRTWQHVGLLNTERIHRIVLHPTDRDTVWVAALGQAWGENPERGVYKTVDGGATWQRVLYVDESTGAADLVIDPTNSNKLFAAMWDYRRWPWSFRSGGPSSGLYVTHDGGENWRRLTTDDGMPEGELGRIGVAIAPSEPDIVYALVEAKKSALLRSDDGGHRFRTVNDDPGIANRPFYYADLRVDTKRPDRVYSLHSIVTVSDDGGKTFTPLVPFRDVHPDHHAWWIHPDDPTFIINGNDGGVAISHDRGHTWRFVANLPLAQFYHISFDTSVPYNVYGGLQDNGSWRGPSTVWENGSIRNHHWEEVGFGDGFATLADPVDPTTGYAMSQEGYLHRWDVRTGERKRIRPAAADTPLRFNWNAAIAIDPFDRQTVYFGSQFVHRSTDRGETWQVLSPDLTTNNPDWQKQDESGGVTLDVTGAENFTSILTIAPSPVKQGEIWVGTDDGLIHLTRDGGRTWNSAKHPPGVPTNTWIPHIEPSRFAEGAAFVVFDDHRRSNWQTYVFATTNYGQTWKDLSSDTLRGYALTFAQDPVDENLLFLGTEFGLWCSVNGGDSWLQLTHGFPTVSAKAVRVHPVAHDVIVGTHGRAAYIIDDISPLRGLTAEIMAKPLHLFAMPPAQQYRVKQTGASRFPGNGEFRGKNRPYGALITFVANGDKLPAPREDDENRKRDKKAPKVKIEVHDASGTRMARFERPLVRGINRISWNLRRDEFRRPPRRNSRPRTGSGPRGPEVPPGDYQVTLKHGDQEVRGTVRVIPDPRFEIPMDERMAKWRTVLEVGAWTELVTDCVDRLREVHDDIAAVRAKVKRAHARLEPDDRPHKDLLDAAKELEKALDAVEDQLKGPRKPVGIPPRKHVLAKIGTAGSSLGSSWDAPDPAQERLMAMAKAALEEGVAATNKLLAEDVARFREAVAAAKLALFPERPPVVIE